MGDLISVLTDNLDEWVAGFWVTVRLVVFSFVIAMVVGTLVAALRISPNKMWQRVGGVYVETFRNIPLLVLLFISFAGLRRAGVGIGPPGAPSAATRGWDWLDSAGRRRATRTERDSSGSPGAWPRDRRAGPSGP